MKKIERILRIVLLSFLIFPFLSYSEINLKIISEHKDKKLIQNFKRYVPDFNYEFYPWDSEFSHNVITELEPDRLPIIIYDEGKLTSQEKENLIKKRIMIKRGNYYLFPPQRTHYLTRVKLLNRERIPHQLAIFTMSLCPFAKKAEWRLIKFIRENNLPVDLKIHFIASKKDGKITSMHGPDEVEEDIHQVLIQKYWPHKLFDYLLLTEKVSHFEALKKVGISYTRIDRLRQKGKKLLAEDIKLADELGINASPTFMWENIYLISGLDNVMELLENRAKQIYEQTHPVVKYIFLGQKESEEYKPLFNYLETFFRWKGSFIPYTSPLASKYIKRYRIEKLPYILIKKSDKKTNSIIRKKLKWEETEYGFILPPEIILKYCPIWYLKRKEIPGKVDIVGRRKDIKVFKNSSFIKTLRDWGMEISFHTVGLFSKPEIYTQLGVRKLPLILWENKYLLCELSQLLHLGSFQEKITSVKTDRKIYLDFFHSPSCYFCREVEEKILPKIKQKYGGIVDIVYFNTLNEKNHRFLMRMEEFRKIEERGIPKIFVGDKVLIGRSQIQDNLEQEILTNLISGGEIFRIKNPLVVYYFYNSHELDKNELEKKIFDSINQIENRYQDGIILKKYDTADRKNVSFMLSLVRKIEGDEDSDTPKLVINNKIYTEDEIDNLDRIIQENLLVAVEGERNIVLDKLMKFSLPAVLTAGLLDGINPCAFTVIVFFISFLTFAGYRRKQMVYTGFSFILAVFIAYFLIGLGIFTAFYKLKLYRTMAELLRYVIAGIVLILAGFNIYDYIVYKIKKTPHSTILQLPQRIKFLIQRTISASYRKKDGEIKGSLSLLGMAFICGFVISLLESVCTGQVYFPTIGLLIQLPPELKVKSILYLFLYNLMFIIPLVFVFSLGLWGISSEQFAEFMKKHLSKIKLATAFLFLFLAYILVVI